jgi:hypothetical protein
MLTGKRQGHQREAQLPGRFGAKERGGKQQRSLHRKHHQELRWQSIDREAAVIARQKSHPTPAEQGDGSLKI